MLKVDHNATQAALNKIVDTLAQQRKAYENYNEEKDNAKDQSMYSAEYRAELADKALVKLKDLSSKNGQIFAAEIDKARACESSNDKALDFTDEKLLACLSALDGIANAGDKSSQDFVRNQIIIDAILEEMKGQRNALELIKNKLEGKGYEIKKNNAYFYEGDLFENLEAQLLHLSNNPSNSLLYIECAGELRKLANVLGLTLDESKLSVGSIGGGAFLEALRAASAGA